MHASAVPALHASIHCAGVLLVASCLAGCTVSISVERDLGMMVIATANDDGQLALSTCYEDTSHEVIMAVSEIEASGTTPASFYALGRYEGVGVAELFLRVGKAALTAGDIRTSVQLMKYGLSRLEMRWIPPGFEESPLVFPPQQDEKPASYARRLAAHLEFVLKVSRRSLARHVRLVADIEKPGCGSQRAERLGAPK